MQLNIVVVCKTTFVDTFALNLKNSYFVLNDQFSLVFIVEVTCLCDQVL